MMKKTGICVLVLTGCLLAAGLAAGGCLAAEPERTGYIPPAHNFLYEDNNGSNTVGTDVYENNRQAAGKRAQDAGFLGNSTRGTDRRGYIPPAHYFLYE